MDHLPRLIACLLLWFVAGSAHAAYVFVKPPFWRTGNDSTTEAASALESCQKMVTKFFSGRTAEVRNYAMQPSGAYYYRCGYYGSSGTWVSYQDTTSRCTNGSFSSTTGQPVAGIGSCYWSVTSCPAGQQPDANGVCTNPCDAKAGQDAGPYTWPAGSTSGVHRSSAYICDPGGASGASCLILAGEPDFCFGDDSGTWRCTSRGTYTGATCNPNDSGDGTGAGNAAPGQQPPTTDNPGSAGEDAPPPCPAGQAPGTVNGVSVCMPVGPNTPSSSGSSKEETKNNADGSTTNTKTDSKTTCTGDTCTTTNTNTTTNTPAGGGAGTTTTTTTTTTQSKGEFCKANPQDAQCGSGDGKQGFGGSCTSGFQCTGDAVECAMAREQHVRNCQMFDATGPYRDYTEMPGLGESRPDGHPGNDPIELNVFDKFQDIAEDDSPETCPVDTTVTIMDRTLTIPWSVTCDGLKWMGRIAWCFALVHSMFIFMRRI